MGARAKDQEATTNRAFWKAVGFAAFIIGALCLLRFTGSREYMSPESLDRFLRISGLWAPFFYVLTFAAGVCVLVPASVLTVTGAALFGSYWGFIYSWIGAMAGASGAFLIGRTLGRDFAESLLTSRLKKLKKYDNAIERNGFVAVLYLRLLNAPFTYMNYGVSLTKVGFRDFFWGTCFGVVFSLFALTFLGGTLMDVWRSGNWTELIGPRTFIAAALFILSFLIPLIIKIVKGNREEIIK